MFATTWATGQIFLITMAFFLWLLWLWLIVRICIDVFSSHDLSGPKKAMWVALLLIFPFVSVIAYLVTRGSESIRGPMHAVSPSDQAIQRQMRAAH
jgi:hypothetical protein